MNADVDGFLPLRIAVLTISDTRTAADDRSGDLLAERVITAGHRLAARGRCRDEIPAIVDQLRAWIDGDVDVVVTTGGTGVTARDVTPEALAAIADKHIPGFGEYFRYISIAAIGASMMQSRACAVVSGGTYIFALPGSPGAVRDGWDQILETQLDSRHRPCNFAQLLPRLAR